MFDAHSRFELHQMEVCKHFPLSAVSSLLFPVFFVLNRWTHKPSAEFFSASEKTLVSLLQLCGEAWSGGGGGCEYETQPFMLHTPSILTTPHPLITHTLNGGDAWSADRLLQAH